MPTVSWKIDIWNPSSWTTPNISYENSLDLLSDRDIARYRSHRKTIGPTYTLASLRKHEPALDEAIARILDALRNLRAETVDLKEWMHASVVECLGAVVLGGWSPRFLELKTDCGTSAHAHMMWRRKSVMGLFPQAVVLGLLHKPAAYIFNVVWGIRHSPPEDHKPFFPAVHRRLSKRINNAMSGQATPNQETIDLLDELIQLHKDKPDAFPVDCLRRMAMTNFGAGHETMTSAMVSALAMIGTHPEAQARIHRELNAHAYGSIMPHEEVEQLLYTMAAIKEAQRLYPVIGMSLPRTVPEKELQVHGHTFPQGTTVGCAPVALHRNEAIFGPDPEAYAPERWIDVDRKTRNMMERINLTYGGGARSCPGKHMAELVVHKLVTAILHEFEVVVDMPPEEEVKYYFLAMLTGTEVRFVARTAT
jgi:cytochrome P450